MKRIVRNLSDPFDKIEIHTFADWHKGDVHCNDALIRQRINHVLTTPNAFCILNGDILNNATKTSVSDCYAERLTPQQQLNWAEVNLAPLAKAHKILAINPGNHEGRTYRTDGIDLTQVLARQLNCEDICAKESSTLFLRFGNGNPNTHHHRKICYVIHSIHGSGGGRKEGAKAIRLADMASIIDADVYIHAHTHLPFVMKEGFFRTTPCSNSVQPVEHLFVNTSSALGYGGYGERFEFKPGVYSTPVIYLSGVEKYATAVL